METWLGKHPSALPPPRPSHHHIPPSPCFLSGRPASSPLSGWCFEKHLSQNSDSQASFHPEDGEALRVVLWTPHPAWPCPPLSCLSPPPSCPDAFPPSSLARLGLGPLAPAAPVAWNVLLLDLCIASCPPGFCFNITPSRGHPVWNSSRHGHVQKPRNERKVWLMGDPKGYGGDVCPASVENGLVLCHLSGWAGTGSLRMNVSGSPRTGAQWSLGRWPVGPQAGRAWQREKEGFRE